MNCDIITVVGHNIEHNQFTFLSTKMLIGSIMGCPTYYIVKQTCKDQANDTQTVNTTLIYRDDRI